MGIFDSFKVKKLIKVLKDRGDDDAVKKATESLREIGEPAVKPLIIALKDEDSDVREEAARVLGEIGEPAVEPLIHVLKDENSDVRVSAAEALGKIGEPAVKPLIIALKDEDSDVREEAARVLGEIGEPAVEPLIHVLKDEDSDVRVSAAEALGKIGEPAVEPLIQALKDEGSDIRRGAAEALGKIEDERAVDPLIYVLKDKNEAVRRKAAEALGKIGDERAVEPLIHALKDEDYRIREKAARALMMIGKPAVEPLIYALKDKDYWVRKTAAKVLDEIGDERAIEPLSHFKKESENSIVGLGVEMSIDNKQDRQGAETLEILFDIDDLGGGFYGNKAWRIFMKNCDPDRLLNSVLLEGDISETLAGHERIFCIAVQNLDLSVITYLKESFESCEEKGLLPLDKRLIEGNVTDVTSRVIRGSIDSFGKFVTNEWTRIDEDLCKECGWEYAPDKGKSK